MDFDFSKNFTIKNAYSHINEMFNCDDDEVVYNNEVVITKGTIEKAEQVLIDNGIEKDEAWVVLQALGYVLFDGELYPESI